MRPATASNSIQYIGEVSASGGSQVAAGTFHGNVTFVTGEDSKEKAARECRNTLYLTDPSVDRSSIANAKGQRVPGTCEWLLSLLEYQAWFRGDPSDLLWISGGPGKGKTVLTIFLTEELERFTQGTSDSEVIYYFCGNGDYKRRDATAVLRSLLWQVVTRYSELVIHILPHFESVERTKETLNSREALWSLLHKLLRASDLRTLFCVIDGLDECDDDSQRWFASKLVGETSVDSLRSNGNRLKMLIVSRDILLLRKARLQIMLDSKNEKGVTQDVKRYISAKVEHMSELVELDHDFKTEIGDQLWARSEGTFLWVGFAIEQLLRKKTPIEIERTLATFPSGLPAIYGRMFHQLDPDYRQVCCMILRWVAYAARPVSLQELGAAIGTRSSPLVNKEQVVKDQVTICGSFVTLQHYGVALVHQSLRDYLLHRSVDVRSMPTPFQIKPEEVHLQLSWRCLEYIEQSKLRQVKANSIREKYDLIQKQRPLLDYAIRYWAQHAKLCEHLGTKLLDHPSKFFEKGSIGREEWWNLYAHLRAQEGQGQLPVLHLACYLGIAPWVRHLLGKKSSRLRFPRLVNRTDTSGARPLQYAAQEGHQAVMQVLIDEGVAVDAQDQSGLTALHAACMKGHMGSVRLLLRSGADVNKQCARGLSALHKATYGGLEPLIPLLLDYDAAMDIKCSDGETPLLKAVFFGNLLAVRFLLQRGADTNIKYRNGDTMLDKASMGGFSGIIRLLLDSGLDVDMKGQLGQTALQTAALVHKEDSVRLLFHLGADINMKDPFGWTALHTIVHQQNGAMSRVLLELGADVNIKDLLGWQPLHYAVWSGSNELARLLIDSGAETIAREDVGGQDNQLHKLDDDIVCRLNWGNRVNSSHANSAAS